MRRSRRDLRARARRPGQPRRRSPRAGRKARRAPRRSHARRARHASRARASGRAPHARRPQEDASQRPRRAQRAWCLLEFHAARLPARDAASSPGRALTRPSAGSRTDVLHDPMRERRRSHDRSDRSLGVGPARRECSGGARRNRDVHRAQRGAGVHSPGRSQHRHGSCRRRVRRLQLQLQLHRPRR